MTIDSPGGGKDVLEEMGKLPKIDPEKSRSEAFDDIEKVREAIAKSGAESTAKREAVINGEKSPLDSPIATIALAHLIKRFPAASGLRASRYARSISRRAMGQASRGVGDTWTASKAGLTVGATSAATAGAEWAMRIGQTMADIHIPRAQAGAAAAFTLGMLLYAAAGPVRRAFGLEQRHFGESLDAGRILGKMVKGGDNELREIRTLALHGDETALEAKCEAMIDAILGKPDEKSAQAVEDVREELGEEDTEGENQTRWRPPSALRRRGGKLVPMAMLAGAIALGAAAVKPPFERVLQADRVATTAYPGIDLMKKMEIAQDPKKAEEAQIAFLQRVWSEAKFDEGPVAVGREGLKELSNMFVHLGENIGVALGIVDAPPASSGRATPKKR